MQVFISHSFEDDARFDDLCHALERENISYWHPKEMRAGFSLRDQLRKAIDTCDLCIFLATKNSVESNWCSAELGAFWGARKKVVIYVVDDSLSDDDLPQQFKGDIWHRKIREVIRESKLTLNEVAKKQKLDDQEEDASAKVGDISVGVLLDLLRTVLNRGNVRPPFSETMSRIYALVSSNLKGAILDISPDLKANLTPYLSDLIGESKETLKSAGLSIWDAGFSITTSTGYWIGYSCHAATHAGGDVEVYAGCLIVHLKDDLIDSCAIVTHVNEIGISTPIEFNIGEVLAADGKVLPGKISSLGAFRIEGKSK